MWYSLVQYNIATTIYAVTELVNYLYYSSDTILCKALKKVNLGLQAKVTLVSEGQVVSYDYASCNVTTKLVETVQQ